MIRVNNIKLSINYNDSEILISLSKKFKCQANLIKSFKILKKSVDARHKDDIKYVVSLKVEVDKLLEKKLLNLNDVQPYKKDKYNFILCNNKIKSKPVVIGAGPAGLFSAYILAKAGLNPIIIERGEKIEERIKSVNDFFEKGILNENSNIQFGEGGAGTFSDGKLNTGIKDKRITFVLETFVKFGAPKEILYEQKPHIGTDILRKVIVDFRKEIENLGGLFLFSTKFDSFKTIDNKIFSILLSNEKTIYCERLVLAIGHSARDTFYSLYDNKLEIIQKPFAIGARIEHSQEFINKTQYGNQFNNPLLPTADYKTAVHLPNGRSVFSFCMCPGGYVVAAASEKGKIAVNGMSNYAREGLNANSALLVNVSTSDFGSEHPLAGIEFQREIEKKAYDISGSYYAPCETLGSFLYNKNNKLSSINPTYQPNVTLCKMSNVLPDFICNSLRDGILLIDKKIRGFADDSALLTAPETRSSSPVRILRNDDYLANVNGIYPCGEGAGYAGGITSAAVDGIKAAEKIIESYL